MRKESVNRMKNTINSVVRKLTVDLGGIYPADNRPTHAIYRAGEVGIHGPHAVAISHHWSLDAAISAADSETFDCEIFELQPVE